MGCPDAPGWQERKAVLYNADLHVFDRLVHEDAKHRLVLARDDAWRGRPTPRARVEMRIPPGDASRLAKPLASDREAGPLPPARSKTCAPVGSRPARAGPTTRRPRGACACEAAGKMP